MRRAEGSVSLEYLGLVAAIAAIVVALAVVRPHSLGARAPVRPVPAIVRLIGRPLVELHPPRPSRPRAPRPARPRRPRPRPDPPPLVPLPDWAVGP
ncbi:MAG TPA: hypothetical protein VKD47_01085 [Miltoncostaeaceae bacterium]|nr:hypothetical protein [Miltoncostaeaceae bacterium]